MRRHRAVLFTLLACSASWAFAQERIANDWDGDGVLNAKDACPRIPAARDGIDESVFCGPKLRDVIDDYVFLWSRTFRPAAGIAPELAGRRDGPFHALLHVAPDKGRRSLSAEQRKAIEAAGVTLLGYLPHRTYYARFASPKALAAVADLPAVHGVGALRPEDRLDPLLRLEGGPLEGRDEDGRYTLSVTFFGAEIGAAARDALERIGAELLLSDGGEAHVRVNGDEGLAALARIDAIETITDIAGSPSGKTANARTLIGLDAVDANFNLFGAQRSIAIAEVGVIPFGHPDLEPRVRRRSFFPSGQSLGTLLLPDVLELDKVINSFAGAKHAQFVGSIIAGSGRTLGANRGLLPEVELLSYSALAPLHIQRFYRIGQDARDNFDAMALNYSIGPENLNRPGAYLNRGRWLDRTVRWHDLPLVWAAGNEGCGPGATCSRLVPSLPHPVAKNDISVGNFSLRSGTTSTDSSAGPAADGRLKPDLLAPGTGIATVNYNALTGALRRWASRGTSAAAPVVTGVVGMLTERFVRDGRPVDSIRPALLKAILLETAGDVGAPGPDFLNGYGLVDATEAVRLVRDPARVFEGAVQETDGPLSFTLAVDQPRPDLSVTLVWSDIPGQSAATLSLINDLDLRVISPSGETFRPFDLTSPPTSAATLALGTQPCTSNACTDILNNVEQVFVDTDGLLETGDWTITVVPSRVIPIFPTTPRQDFSVAVSAPCPVIIRRDTVLDGDIECPVDPLAPAVVKVVSGATLDCAGFTIRGSGFSVGGSAGQIGIAVQDDGAVVRDCTVEQVTTGIRVDDSASGVLLEDNRVRDTRATAIELLGQRSVLRGNTVRRVHGSGAAGIRVSAGSAQIEGNTILPFPNTPNPPGNEVGVHWAAAANAGSGAGFIRDNTINGASFGIVVDAGTITVNGLDIAGNQLEGTRRDAITIAGLTNRTRVHGNTIQSFGANAHGIIVTGGDDQSITGNEIVTGPPAQALKTCILARRVNESIIGENDLSGCGIGIVAFRNAETSVVDNVIETSSGGTTQPTRIGLSSSFGSAPPDRDHIARNSIRRAETGIVIAGETNARLSENTLEDVDTGARLRPEPGSHVLVEGGRVDAKRLGLGVSGGRVDVEGVAFLSRVPPGASPGDGIAIGTPGCDDVTGTTLERNTFDALERALTIDCDAAELTIRGNTFSDNRIAIAHGAGAAIADLELQGNTFEGNGSHALFETPVIGSENRWNDIDTLRIVDADGDGFGDCGADYPYTSRSFSGTSAAAGRSDLSTEV